MSFIRSWIGVYLPLAFLPVVLFLTGCGDQGGRSTVTPVYLGSDEDEGGETEVKREKLPTNGYAKDWEGTIVFEGALPKISPLNIKDKSGVCDSPMAIKNGDTVEHTWIIDSDSKGVKNVVVFLEPPLKKYYFEIRKEDTQPNADPAKDMVDLDQPYCAYRPHVQGYFSTYYDEDGYKWSPKHLMIKNSSATGHNIKFSGVNLRARPKVKPPSNLNLVSGSEKEVKIWPQDTPLSVSCDIHPWMSGLVWSFDHPYFAITDEKGKFKIPYIPAGQEVRVVVWHESLPGRGFLENGEFKGRDGKLITFNKDEVPKKLNLSISNK